MSLTLMQPVLLRLNNLDQKKMITHLVQRREIRFDFKNLNNNFVYFFILNRENGMYFNI